ncbi:hypothetical protein E2C01_070219 [Portunus trituberculatus]|uniref:Uncharacterized protein n=1 Tax=Portunus trituberculatus TaxID=210409 RepID=A0A5B7HWP8_PORTR|nr:hypothetical protein [Portunus trituberculatus]
MTTGTRMPKRFVPQYDVKIRGGRLITEWRFGSQNFKRLLRQGNTFEKKSTITGEYWPRSSYINTCMTD